MQEITVDVSKVEDTMLFLKSSLPEEGWIQLYVPRGFVAVIISRDGLETVYGEGRKGTLSRGKIEVICFVKKQITVPLGWSIDDISYNNSNGDRVTSAARGCIYICVQHSRKLAGKLLYSEIVDARSVIKLFSDKLATVIRESLKREIPGEYNVEQVQNQISDNLFNVFNDYGLCLERFVIEGHELKNQAR